MLSSSKKSKPQRYLPASKVPYGRSKKRKTLGVVHLSWKRREKRCEPFTKAQKYVKSSHLARKSATRDIPFRMDGWRDGGKRNIFCVFRVVVDVIRHHQERRWVEYELRLARVNTNTRWGHHSQVRRDPWHEKKKYWASPSHQEVAESWNWRWRHARQHQSHIFHGQGSTKNKKRTGFSTPRWNEIGKQNMTWDKIHPKTINSSLYLKKE